MKIIIKENQPFNHVSDALYIEKITIIITHHTRKEPKRKGDKQAICMRKEVASKTKQVHNK